MKTNQERMIEQLDRLTKLLEQRLPHEAPTLGLIEEGGPEKVQALDQLTSCEEAQIDALIDRLCKLPTWRNTSEAITKLEEANLWLKAGPASRKKFRDGMQAYQG